ncbi:MAG: hypothetical protein IPK94_18615 [Saprospiraceae bacterium]|nr:hypothetical protein [Saprospiraceae bacterium]
MRITTLLVTLIVFLSICLVDLKAQPPKAEDLLKEIHTSDIDSIKAEGYYQLSQITRYTDLPAAKKYADSGLYLYQKLHHDAGIQQRVYLDAVLAYSAGDYTKSLESALKYQDWTIKTKNIEREWYAVSQLAMIYRETGDLPMGIKASLRGVEIGVALNRDNENGFFYNELGNLYSNLKQWDEANKYFLKSYQLSKDLKYPPGQSVSLRNLTANAIEQKSFDNARKYINESLEIDLASKWDLGISRSYRSLAKIFESTNITDSAILSYNIALQHLNNDADHYDFAVNYQGLARNYLVKNQLDSVEKYLTLADKIAKNLTAADYSIEQKKIKATWYEKTGNYKQATSYLKSYVDENDQQLSKDIAAQITGLNVRFESQRKEDQITLLTTENELASTRLKSSRLGLLASLIGLIIFSLGSYYIYRLWQTTKNQNNVISKSLQEKETLIKEIHHRVKNNLQFISSLLNLQSRHVDDAVALAALKESQDRVRSMALIHQNLYRDHNFTSIDSKTYFEMLVKSLFQSYNIQPGKINLIMDIDPVQIDVDSMIPIGLILNELISNSLKYAFPGDATGTIHVALKEKNNELLLSVDDNGIGMPEDQLNQRGQSFGYRLIHAFKNQLDADLTVTNTKGTSVIMMIKQYKKAA